MIELPFFSSRDECLPLRLRENEDRAAAVILRVPNANTIRLQWGYLNTATIQITEGTLTPKGTPDICWTNSVRMVVRVPA